MQKNVLIFLLSAFFFLVFADIATAIEPPNLTIPLPFMESFEKVAPLEGDVVAVPWIAQYMRAFYRISYVFAGIIAVIMVIIAGFMWSSSRGNQNQISKSRDLIISSLVGLSIILGGYTILYTISPELTTMKGIQVVVPERQEAVSSGPTPGQRVNVLDAKFKSNLNGCLDNVDCQEKALIQHRKEQQELTEQFLAEVKGANPNFKPTITIESKLEAIREEIANEKRTDLIEFFSEDGVFDQSTAEELADEAIDQEAAAKINDCIAKEIRLERERIRFDETNDGIISQEFIDIEKELNDAGCK